MHANSFTVSMFWNSFKLWLPHSLGTHLPPSVEHLTWIPVLQVYSLVSLKCQWPEVAVCDLIWIVLQFSRVAWSLVTTYTDESLPSVHFMDIICLCLLWDADVEYLSHIWSAMCYMWKKLQDIVCFLWKTSSSHSGPGHQTARVSWVKKCIGMKYSECLDIRMHHPSVLWIPDLA